MTTCTKTTAVALTIFGWCLGAAQQGKTLAEFLPTLKWDVAKSGPLIVVDPAHVTATAQGASLQAFDRKLVVVGHLSAIAPTQMVLIDDNFKEPDMYQGLSINDKVLYFLSLLSLDQVGKATTDGLSKSDLRGEQLSVFNSLMPASISWTTRVYDAKGQDRDVVDQGTVPPEQMDQVKLKVQANYMFHVYQSDHSGSYAMIPQGHVGKEGDKETVREDSLNFTHLYGADPRQTVPNKQKESQLSYGAAAFDPVVTLPSQSTVGELVHLVGDAIHAEIHADFRVAALPVISQGANVRAGDLLQALALCVTGTFRKIGVAYILTSDVKGAGQSKLKLAAWLSLVGRQQSARANEWRKQIARSGALARIGFDPKDPMAPDAKTLSALNRVDDNWQDDKVSTAELVPAIRTFLGSFVSYSANVPHDVDRVGLHSEIHFAFVLPDGRTMAPDPNKLGYHIQFTGTGIPPADDTAKVEPFTLNPSGKHTLMVRAENSPDAMKAVALARAHGFTDIWLVTHDKNALMAALQIGVHVSLAIRPWEAVGNSAQESLDRNLLGDTAEQLSAMRSVEAAWQEYVKNAESLGDTPPPLYNLTSPLDPANSYRWADFANLLHAPGLAGAVLLDSEPPGYEPVYNNTSRLLTEWITDLNQLGYADDLRLAFVRERGIDPIDFTAKTLYVPFDLKQPFFSGEDQLTTDHRPVMESIPGYWQSFRATKNGQGIQPLLALFADASVPMLLMPRSPSEPISPNEGRWVLPWTPGTPAPVLDLNARTPPPNLVTIFPFPEDVSEAGLRNLGKLLKAPVHSVAIDASSVKVENLEKLLDKYFPKVSDN